MSESEKLNTAKARGDGPEQEIAWGIPSRADIGGISGNGTIIEMPVELKTAGAGLKGGAAAAAGDQASASSGTGGGEPRKPLLSELIAEESRKSLLNNPPLAIAERWEIQNRLGQGGMSTVYKARHLVMNKICAVKILNSNLTSKFESLQRFQREAKAASSLNHPNIVCVLDCGITNEQHAFLIMDYLEGESLGDLLKKEYKLLPERAVPIFLQTCEALTHAHERSVIHRDLKPSNLMLIEQDSKKDFVKIVDFGIAKLLDVELSQNEETHQRLTHTGDIFGSPLYMSPEQCSGRESDRRSDIYSMGCLMYETLSGVPPFVGTNTLDTIRLKLNDVPPSFTTAKSDRLSKRLNSIIQKCLEQHPDDRYATMDLLRKDIILARDESEAVWHSRALANRKRWRGSALRLTSKKVISAVVCAILLSVGTTIYLDSTNSNLPSEYENKSLWTNPKFVLENRPVFSSKPRLLPSGPPLAPTQGPQGEQVSEELINKFRDADALRVNKKFEQAVETFRWTLKKWNDNEAQDLPGAKWTLTTSKVFYALGLCKAKLGNYEQANDCYQKAIDYAQKDSTTPPELLKDMQRMYERNLWKVNPVKAMMRVLSKQEMLPPGAS